MNPRKTAVAACVHHWRIAEPNGPTCPGRCLTCGAVREFPTGEQTPGLYNGVPTARYAAKRRGTA